MDGKENWTLPDWDFYQHVAVCTYYFLAVAGREMQMGSDLGMDILIRNAAMNLRRRDHSVTTHSSTLRRHTWFWPRTSILGYSDPLVVGAQTGTIFLAVWECGSKILNTHMTFDSEILFYGSIPNKESWICLKLDLHKMFLAALFITNIIVATTSVLEWIIDCNILRNTT